MKPHTHTHTHTHTHLPVTIQPAGFITALINNVIQVTSKTKQKRRKKCDSEKYKEEET